MMNCGQFEQRGRDLAGKLDSLNKEKSKLLLEVGKLEQEAEVMTADRGALDSRPPFGEQTTFTGGTDHPHRGTDHPHRGNKPLFGEQTTLTGEQTTLMGKQTIPVGEQTTSMGEQTTILACPDKDISPWGQS